MASTTLATLISLLALEGLVRLAYVGRNAMVGSVPLPYVIGQGYGPIPPWIDGLRILEPDSRLIWRNQPGVERTYIDLFTPAASQQQRLATLRRFIPTIPEELRGNPVWEIALNSEGYRDIERPQAKPKGAFRVVCLGDSWTFGWNVDQTQAYPQRLQRILDERFPAARFEVFNLGVGGYSSWQGLALLKLRALELEPDVVVIGFAMNDADVAGYRDQDMIKEQTPAGSEARSRFRVRSLPQHSELYRLLRYVAARIRYQPRSLSRALQAGKGGKDAPAEDVDYAELEPWTRVSPTDFESNILEMVRLTRSRQAEVVLLFNELWTESPYLGILERIAKAEAVPLIDSASLIFRRGVDLADALETRLGLEPHHAPTPAGATGTVDLVFRVYVPDREVPVAIFLVGGHSELGDAVPNRLRMHDDGTLGDQVAGDDVWTLSVRLPVETTVRYMYTNSGPEGRWEGLDVPKVRMARVHGVPDGSPLFLPIDTFGTIYMQADNYHTNSEGYDLIARRVLDAMLELPRVEDHLSRLDEGRPETTDGGQR